MEKEKGGRRENTGEGRRKKEDKRRGMHTVKGRKRGKGDKRAREGGCSLKKEGEGRKRQETKGCSTREFGKLEKGRRKGLEGEGRRDK